MFRSTRVQILVAVIFGLLAALLVWRYTQTMQLQVLAAQQAIAPTPIPTVVVLVAAVDVPSRTLLTADMVKVIQLPTELRLETALTRPDDAIGKVTLYPVARGEQILPAKFSIDRTIQTFSYVIPLGKRAIAITTNEEQGAGGMIAPGDHIDVIAAYDPLIVGGMSAKTIFQNVLVLAVSQSYMDQTSQATVVAATPGAAASTPASVPLSPQQQVHPDAKTITLALSPEESQKLFLAEQHGALRYVLRAINDAATNDVAESVLTTIIALSPQPAVASTPAATLSPTPTQTATKAQAFLFEPTFDRGIGTRL